MSEAEDKKNPPGASPSMEDILQSIRGVISGEEADGNQDQSDVLELVEVLEEGSMANTLIAAASEEKKEEPVFAEKSILDDIDEALDDGSAKPEDLPHDDVLAAMEENQTPVPASESSASQDALFDNIVVEEPAVSKELNGAADISFATNAPVESIADPEVVEVQNEAQQPLPAQKSQAKSSRLLDEDALQQSSFSLKSLVNTINEKQVDSPHTRGGTSLEDLVIEAMKPFLAEWLNKNLPVIVKKIVEKEVKRLIPKEEDEY
jgi:hypothetical protein